MVATEKHELSILALSARCSNRLTYLKTLVSGNAKTATAYCGNSRYRNLDKNWNQLFAATTSNPANPVTTVRSEKQCVACKDSRPLWRCTVFRRKTATERTKLAAESKLCFPCLNEGHSFRQCPQSRKCAKDDCSSSHSTLLHESSRIFFHRKIPATRNILKVKGQFLSLGGFNLTKFVSNDPNNLQQSNRTLSAKQTMENSYRQLRNHHTYLASNGTATRIHLLLSEAPLVTQTELLFNELFSASSPRFTIILVS